MALPPVTANWHWKNKNVSNWGREWFERELPTISVPGDKEGEVVSVSMVTDVEGDIELGQRKSKLITIYDCKITLKWLGTASDGTEVKGTLTIPEVSHEITLDRSSDYTYEWSITTETSPAVEALFSVAKSRLSTALEAKFAEFPSAIIDTHGKDLTISGEPSRTGSPAPNNASNTAASAASLSAPVTGKKVAANLKVGNIKTVTVTATFRADAERLFNLLTGHEDYFFKRVAAPPQAKAEPGSEFSLFGGGVKGKYVSLTPNKEIIQSWALQSPTWPTGHSGTMTIALAQSYDSTQVNFSLNGVPTGLEDTIKQNIEQYYIHSLNSIGLGSEL